MTLTDEQYAATLRDRATLAAPRMTLDLGETVRRGARRRRAQRWGAGAAATSTVAAFAAVAVGAITVLGGPDAWRVPVAQEPVTIGTNQVAELAPGITGTNAVSETTTADGRRRWDTGLRFDYGGGSTQRAVRVAFTALDEVGPLSADTSEGIGLGYDSPDGSTLPAWGTMPVTWSRTSALLPTSATFSAADGSAVAQVFAGAVPSWIREPHVLLYFPAGAKAPGGGLPSWLEVPTIPDPQGSGRLLFAIVAQSGVPWSDDPQTQPSVIVLAGDGSSPDVTPVCGSNGLTRACLHAQPDGGAALTAAAEAFGGANANLATHPATQLLPGVEAATGPFAPEGHVTAVGALAGARVVVDRLTDSNPDVMQLAAYDASGYTPGSPQDLPLGPDAALQVATLPGGSLVELFVAPSGDPGARAFVWSAAGWTTSDGATVHAAEATTFELRVPDAEEPDRRFAAVGVAAGVAAPGLGWAFTSTDGSLKVMGCPGRCDGVPYDELDALIGR